jgi:hypothetical protein
MEGASVGGVLDLRRLRASGDLNLRTIRVGQRLLLMGSELDSPGGTACRLSRAQIAADVFADDMTATGRFRLAGLTYRTLEQWLPARQRLPWLARDPRGHQSQPYEQLAAHYTAIGEPAQARAVLYARERLQRQSMRPLTRTWSLLQDVIVGYGFQPWRALAWLALLLAAGSITFAVAPPPPLPPGGTPTSTRSSTPSTCRCPW